MSIIFNESNLTIAEKIQLINLVNTYKKQLTEIKIIIKESFNARKTTMDTFGSIGDSVLNLDTVISVKISEVREIFSKLEKIVLKYQLDRDGDFLKIYSPIGNRGNSISTLIHLNNLANIDYINMNDLICVQYNTDGSIINDK